LIPVATELFYSKTFRGTTYTNPITKTDVLLFLSLQKTGHLCFLIIIEQITAQARQTVTGYVSDNYAKMNDTGN